MRGWLISGMSGGHPTWPILDKMVGWEKRKNRKEKRKREKLYLLSKFSDDWTGSLRRSKRESSSSRQELRTETGIEEF